MSSTQLSGMIYIMDKTILVLDQQDMDSSVDVSKRDSYYRRKAVRAVLSDQDGRIALMHAGQRDYYKLPGGGVDEGEDLTKALERELLEETGCKANVTAELGKVVEWRDVHKMHQISYAYSATVTGEVGSPEFTQSELDEGFKMIWADNVDEAIKLVESKTNHDDIAVVFMASRDAAILRSAK